MPAAHSLCATSRTSLPSPPLPYP
eukprot:SAG11_NODE_27951_length_326_cov_73.621145_1_plen_23_part_10